MNEDQGSKLRDGQITCRPVFYRHAHRLKHPGHDLQEQGGAVGGRGRITVAFSGPGLRPKRQNGGGSLTTKWLHLLSKRLMRGFVARIVKTFARLFPPAAYNFFMHHHPGRSLPELYGVTSASPLFMGSLPSPRLPDTPLPCLSSTSFYIFGTCFAVTPRLYCWTMKCFPQAFLPPPLREQFVEPLTKFSPLAA